MIPCEGLTGRGVEGAEVAADPPHLLDRYKCVPFHYVQYITAALI